MIYWDFVADHVGRRPPTTMCLNGIHIYFFSILWGLVGRLSLCAGGCRETGVRLGDYDGRPTPVPLRAGPNRGPHLFYSRGRASSPTRIHNHAPVTSNIPIHDTCPPSILHQMTPWNARTPSRSHVPPQKIRFLLDGHLCQAQYVSRRPHGDDSPQAGPSTQVRSYDPRKAKAGLS